MNREKVIHFLLIYLLMFPSLVLAQSSIQVKSSGAGITEKDAVRIALRNALEETLGAYISSNSKISNDKLIIDEISSISNGEVLNYRILESTKFNQNEFYVVLEVTLTETQVSNYFTSNKDNSISFQGELFSNNINQIQLNKSSEVSSIKNLIEAAQGYLDKIVDYEVIQTQTPQYISENLYELSYEIEGRTNFNILELTNLIVNSLQKISIDKRERDRLNEYAIPFYKYRIHYGKTGIQTFYFRDKESIRLIDLFADQIKDSYSDFSLLLNGQSPEYHFDRIALKTTFKFLNNEDVLIGKWNFKANLPVDKISNFKISTDRMNVENGNNTNKRSTKKNLNKLIVKSKNEEALSFSLGVGYYSLDAKNFNFPITNYKVIDQRDRSIAAIANIDPNYISFSGYNYFISGGLKLFEILEVDVLYSPSLKSTLNNPTSYSRETFFKYNNLELNTSLLFFKSSKSIRPFSGITYGIINANEIQQYFKIANSSSISAWESGFDLISYSTNQGTYYYGINAGFIYFNNILKGIEIKPSLLIPLGGSLNINSMLRIGFRYNF